MNRLPRNRIIVGDARTVLPTLPEQSVDCVITSPPYFQLRNYQHPEQLGLERHVDDWVHNLLLVGRELRRLLKPSGAFWLNLGDGYSTASADGAAVKSLLLAHERLALALLTDGWILRNKVVWAKTNPMPTSVRDRLSCTHEVVYFFTRERRYFFDLDAIRVPHTSRPSRVRVPGRPAWSVPPEWRGPASGTNTGLDRLKAKGLAGHPLGKNPGDVWSLATTNYRGAHHAVFPEKLAERPLLATCPEKVCNRCGVPWRRQPARTLGHLAVRGELQASCGCRGGTRPGLVLDPFLGSGTVAAVAARLGRSWLGIEINPDFVGLVHERLARTSEREPPAQAA
ncbi:MAG: DNA-methyltransferase [Thermoleophilia bacterium]